MQLTLIFSLVYLAPGRASAAFTFPVAPLRYVRGSFFGAQPESTKASIKSKRFHPRQIRAKIVDKSSRRQILARLARFALYWGSSIDSIQAVIANDYKKGWMSYVDAAEICGTKAQGARRYLPQVYSTIFYFARLRPRLLFSVGALFRALQLCTPLQRIFNPSVGVGAGLNFFSFLAGSRWPCHVVLGFASTRLLWECLGASPVVGAVVPIQLNFQ